MNIPWRHALLSAGLVICVPAFAHSRLLSSTPASNAVLARSPPSLLLDFNEAVEIAFTTTDLVGPATQSIKLVAATDPGGDRSKVVAPLPALTTGTYHLNWTTVGHDGHHVNGTFAFTIK